MNNYIGCLNPDGTTTVWYQPTDKQALFHERTEPKVLFYGGRGSGKSKALRWEAHSRALTTPNFTYCILRRTFPQLQSSHLNDITKEMKALGGTFNLTNKIAHYPNGSKGFFRHCAGEEDILSLLSAEFAWMGFDELSTFEWNMFTMLSASVRVPAGSGLIAMVRACTNPLGICAEEINQYFINKDVDLNKDPEYNPNEWYAIKANAIDNPHLDLVQYKKQFVGLPDHVMKAWIDGDFALENALFNVRPTKTIELEDGRTKEIPYHFVKSLDLEPILKGAQIYRSIDNGWFPDPTYVLWIAHLGNRLIAFHEETFYRTIVKDVVTAIKETEIGLGMRNERGEPKVRVVNTFCDPTMDINTTADVSTIKDIYETNGIPMECSINNREMFASFIHSALGQEASPNVPKLQIYTLGCPYLAKSLPNQRYDMKHPLRLADHKDDHPAVTLAYCLISSAAIDRQSLSQTKQRPWMKDKGHTRWILGREAVR